MRNLVLLFGVRLHLVDLVLALCPNVGRVVATIVHELFLKREVHHVRTNLVHEIGRVAVRIREGLVSRPDKLTK